MTILQTKARLTDNQWLKSLVIRLKAHYNIHIYIPTYIVEQLIATGIFDPTTNALRNFIPVIKSIALKLSTPCKCLKS